MTWKLWGDLLFRNVYLALSPLGDEILYTRLHEPPVNRPHLRIVLRHLRTDAEREVGRATLDIGPVRFMGEGDEVLFGDGMVHTHRVNAWTGEAIATIPAPGHSVAGSRSGKYLLVDGRLFAGDTMLAMFPETSEGVFSPPGRSPGGATRQSALSAFRSGRSCNGAAVAGRPAAVAGTAAMADPGADLH